MIAGCYDLYLICDGKMDETGKLATPCDNTGYDQLYSPAPAELRVVHYHTFVDAAKHAKRKGWKVDRKAQVAQCPKCAPKKARRNAAESSGTKFEAANEVPLEEVPRGAGQKG